jgi:hypothetical protein
MEWSASRIRRRDQSKNHPADLLLFYQFKLPNAVKNCVFAASAENLKISFEKLHHQLWACPVEAILVNPTCQNFTKSPEADVRFDGLSPILCQEHQQWSLQANQTAEYPQDKLKAVSIPNYSITESGATAKAGSITKTGPQDSQVSGSEASRMTEKHARIVAILNAKGSQKQQEPYAHSASAKSSQLHAEQAALSIQQHSETTSEPSNIPDCLSSIHEISATSQQQFSSTLHSVASDSRMTFKGSSPAELHVSHSKVADASDLESCRVELALSRSQIRIQQQQLTAFTLLAENHTQSLKRCETTVVALQLQLKEAAAANFSLQKEIDAVRAENANITHALSSAHATITHLSKSKVDACTGYDFISPQNDVSAYSPLDCIESQLLVNMAEQGVITLRHRNQLMLDKFYESEALRLHKILAFSKKRHVTFKSLLDVGEFCINDSPESVSLARKSAPDSKIDVRDKLMQKRRKKCEGQTKWLHHEAQALCLSALSMCSSSQLDSCVVPPTLSCKGKVISSVDLQNWLSVANSCTKFDIHAPIKTCPSAPLRHRSPSFSEDQASQGLHSVDAALGGLSQSSLCQLCFALRGCSTLRLIDFSFNQFSELVAAALGSLLATACISHLQLSSCDITSSFISRMHLAAPWLTELDISNNDIRDDGLASLTVCLCLETCSLKKLNCANNSLSAVVDSR